MGKRKRRNKNKQKIERKKHRNIFICVMMFSIYGGEAMNLNLYMMIVLNLNIEALISGKLWNYVKY